MTRRNGPYAPLSASYADDDAIAILDMDEDDRTELLYLRALAYCARDPKAEGYVSDIALASGRVLRRQKRKGLDITVNAARLVELGLWRREDGGYRITGWSKWNRTAAEIEAARKRDRQRKGSGRNESADDDDSDWNPDGIRLESDGNPLGFQMDSALARPRVGAALHVTALHDSAGQGFSRGQVGHSSSPSVPRGDE